MLDIQGRKYAAVSVCDVTLYDLITHYPVMYFDTLQVTNLDSSSEVTEIQGGKGNPVLASISHSKNIDVQFDDAIMTMSSLALLTGGELSLGTEGNKITMTQTELVKVNGEAAKSQKITLSHKVKKGSYVYVGEMKNGIVSTVTRSEKTVDTESNEITIGSLFHNYSQLTKNGVTLRVFYEYELGTNDISELTVLADKFAGMYRFVGDTMLFNQFTGLNDVFQIEIPKLKLDGSFSFNLSAAVDAVVFSFKGKALRDDEGRMIVFRNIRADEMKADDAANREVQYDGSHKDIPAVGVSVDPVTRVITNLPGVTYPTDRPETQQSV